MSYKLLNKNLFIVSHPHPAPPPEWEGKRYLLSPLEGRKNRNFLPLQGEENHYPSPFKGEAGGGWGFVGAISPLW